MGANLRTAIGAPDWQDYVKYVSEPLDSLEKFDYRGHQIPPRFRGLRGGYAPH